MYTKGNFVGVGLAAPMELAAERQSSGVMEELVTKSGRAWPDEVSEKQPSW
jgi:hypothetical protein